MKQYHKLVRDGVPNAVRDDGEIPHTHEATGSELETALWAKLDEEVAEFLETKDPHEFADIIETVYAIAEFYGVKPYDVDRMRQEKADERGTFSKGIILERTEQK